MNNVYKHKVAIIGLGGIGLHYDINTNSNEAITTHSKAFSLHNDFLLEFAVDTNHRNRYLFESRYRLPAYHSFSSALNFHTPNVVVIATPTASHLSIVSEVARFPSVKCILCEKPMGVNFQQASEIARVCHANNIKLYVNYIRRCDPSALEVHALLTTVLSSPLKGFCWYSKGLFVNGSHLINLLQYWLGSYTKLSCIQFGSPCTPDDISADFRLSFGSGDIIFQHIPEQYFSHYAIELMLPNGRLRYDEGGFHVSFNKPTCDPVFPGYRILGREPHSIYNDLHRSQFNTVSELANALTGTVSNICTGHDALRTMRILEDIRTQSCI